MHSGVAVPVARQDGGDVPCDIINLQAGHKPAALDAPSCCLNPPDLRRQEGYCNTMPLKLILHLDLNFSYSHSIGICKCLKHVFFCCTYDMAITMLICWKNTVLQKAVQMCRDHTRGVKMSSATLPLVQHTSKSFWCAKAAQHTESRDISATRLHDSQLWISTGHSGPATC